MTTKVQPLGATFTAHWPLHKVLVLAALGLICLGVQFDSAWAAGPIGGVLVVSYVFNWTYHDRFRFRDVAARYEGLALIVWWPILLPVYLVESRGWWRAFVGLGSILVLSLVATLLGVAIVSIV